jgi:hypothetical protein
MSYVDAGYSIVLGILFLYAVSLTVRRRRLTAAAARVAAVGGPTPLAAPTTLAGPTPAAAPAAGGPTDPRTPPSDPVPAEGPS